MLIGSPGNLPRWKRKRQEILSREIKLGYNTKKIYNKQTKNKKIKF